MAANTSPIYPLTPNNGVMNVLLSTALTNTKAFDGTDTAGTALALVFTAGSSGSRVDTLKVKYTSTNGATASGTTTLTLIRFWLNNGSANTTATNNRLIAEISVPAQAVTALGTSELPELTKLVSLAIPAGYKIYAGMTVAIAGTNCAALVSADGGDY